MHRRKSLFALLAVPMVTLAACGGGGDSDEDKITSVINDVKDNPASLCDHFSAAALKSIPGGKAACVKQVKADPPSEADVKASKIKKIEVDGEKATVTNETKSGEATAKFVKEDGEWKFDVQ
ncbi:hypothetical protein DSM112329_04298 [Paraconexibacter sp. AEG42_29]|uniref:DUF4878 domain-containing protein n=1 Tax=Paraconexibacter sp. AEG42_29 TaxID=2997339 RepID=A0AAU7B0L1_9ACTN